MRTSTFLSLAASISSALAVSKGFNYGSTFTDGSAKAQSDFLNEFETAQGLVGAPGFTSARLYTMIQGGTTDTVISAIPAAISSQTTLLLGLWASAGQADITNEITALSNAISQYGTAFTDLVVGISVGSEDLYRISPTGVAALSGAGAEPSDLVSYISQVRTAIAGTSLSGAAVGHVDTWTAWVNGTNDAVITACDFLGMDAYPYFQNTESNAISSGASLFSSAYEATVGNSQGKPVWVTETGWPVSGPTENLAVPGTANAQTYWDQVGCDQLFDQVNTWWYVLQDAAPTTPSPSFGVVGSTLSTTPLYNLTCPAGSSGASSSSSAASSSATSVVSSVASATQPTTVPASATSSISINPVPSASLGTQSASVSAPASSASVVSSSVVSASVASASVASASSASSASAASASVASASVASPSASSASAASVTSKPATSTVSAVSTAVVTTGSSVSVSAGETMTIYHTTLVTITSCSTVCQTTFSTASGSASAPASAPSAVSASSSAVKASSTAPAASASSSASAVSSAAASASACPANIAGDYQYPHLIVPVSSSSPSKALGTQYNGTINSEVSTIFNFDIPQSYAGKQCSLVFLFPELSQLETSSYSFNNQGGIVSHVLNGTASASTTYANQPAEVLQNGAISSLVSGNSYVISSDSCPPGATVSFELSATGGLDLEFFEDYNPSPLGLYVRAC